MSTVPWIVGGALFFGGGTTFMVALFASGGWRKAEQFRVIGELWRGEHGPGKRRAVRLALLLIAAGAIVLMAGQAARDRERARRCEAHCAASGLSGRIGPSTERHPKRSGAAAFVACICEGPGTERQESRADDLMQGP